ncbi:MAG: type II toxin-antitoxin system VapC family toxin [Sedimentisphaeraceae bacterium JB056]
MKIIIDTHIFLWILTDPNRLTKNHIKLITSTSNTIYVSSVSIAEIAIKSSIGKLEFNYNPVELAINSGFEILDFGGNDALLLKDMPFHHKDPFDRMLIAQAISNKYKIMTDDHKFKYYSCKLI